MAPSRTPRPLESVLVSIRFDERLDASECSEVALSRDPHVEFQGVPRADADAVDDFVRKADDKGTAPSFDSREEAHHGFSPHIGYS